ncbi:MAG: hypothetical protein V3575_01940 [Candidatus Absconditabacteria bacterium]
MSLDILDTDYLNYIITLMTYLLILKLYSNKYSKMVEVEQTLGISFIDYVKIELN